MPLIEFHCLWWAITNTHIDFKKLCFIIPSAYKLEYNTGWKRRALRLSSPKWSNSKWRINLFSIIRYIGHIIIYFAVTHALPMQNTGAVNAKCKQTIYIYQRYLEIMQQSQYKCTSGGLLHTAGGFSRINSSNSGVL